MTALSDKAKATYLKQRPGRRIIDSRETVSPEPAAAPDAVAPDLASSLSSDFVDDDPLARLRQKFKGGSAAAIAPDWANGPVGTPIPKRRTRFVVTDAGGQIKTDLVDEETGELEMEQG